MNSLNWNSLTWNSLNRGYLEWKNIDIKSFSLIFVLLISGTAQASFYDRKAEGWHWYDTLRVESLRDSDPLSELPQAELSKTETRNQKDKKEKRPQNDPIAQLETFKQKVEHLKAIAILNPTFGNVKAYMEIQKELMERSTQFANKWLEVVYQTPTLDYTLHHPTSQTGRHVYLDQQRERMETQIRSLSKTHGLFFFYSSQCAYCKQFSPIVKSFSSKYGWEVLPISLDGTFLPEFPSSRRDNGTAKALGVQSLPTLLAIEPKSGKVIPLSYGMSTHDQIEDRIRVLLMKRSDL